MGTTHPHHDPLASPRTKSAFAFKLSSSARARVPPCHVAMSQESIEFAHPVTGERVRLRVPPPPFLVDFLTKVALRLPR